MKNRIIRKVALLLCLMFSLLTFTTTALAYDLIDTDREVTLTLNVTQDDVKNPGTDIALPGVTFRLYRVADVDLHAQYTLTPSFANCDVDLTNISDAGQMKEVADTLQLHILAEGIKENAMAISGNDGKLTFICDKPGLFLVLAENMENESFSYFFSPVVVVLPWVDEDGHWNYEQTADIKMERSEKYKDIMVIKSWKETSGIQRRPKTLKINVLCDGVKVTTIELNKENGWKYELINLSAAHDWTVVEDFRSQYYTPSYGEMIYDGDNCWHIVITNTYKQPGSDIPDTGMLWWPVPLLAIGGMFLFAAGWIINRKGSKRA